LTLGLTAAVTRMKDWRTFARIFQSVWRRQGKTVSEIFFSLGTHTPNEAFNEQLAPTKDLLRS
jgi:hypothetical protein